MWTSLILDYSKFGEAMKILEIKAEIRFDERRVSSYNVKFERAHSNKIYGTKTEDNAGLALNIL